MDVYENLGDFYHAGHYAILAPWCLVYYLAPAALGDGVGVALAGGEHMSYHGCGGCVVAVKKIFADKIAAFAVELVGRLIHIYNHALGIAHCHRAVHLIGPQVVLQHFHC